MKEGWVVVVSGSLYGMRVIGPMTQDNANKLAAGFGAVGSTGGNAQAARIEKP